MKASATARTIYLLSVAIATLSIFGTGVAQAAPSFDYEGSITGPQGGFGMPRSIALDSSGKVYVVDGSAGKNRVEVFSSMANGNEYITNLEGGGGSPNQVQSCKSKDSEQVGLAFDNPWGVTVDRGSSKAVYVADSDNDRIQIFRPKTGGFGYLDYICVDEQPLALESFAPNRIYQSSFGEGQVTSLTARDMATGEILDAVFVSGFLMDIATDQSGRVYITEGMFDRFYGFDSLANGHKPLDLGDPFSSSAKPFSVATDSKGRVYVGELYPSLKYGGGRIRVFSSPESGFNQIASIEELSTPNGKKKLTGPVGLAIDGTRVYVVDASIDTMSGGGSGGGNNMVWRLRFDDANADGKFDQPPPPSGVELPGKPPVSPGTPMKTDTPTPQVKAVSKDTDRPYSRITNPQPGCKKKKSNSKGSRSCKQRKSLAHSKKSLQTVLGIAGDKGTGVATVDVAIGKARTGSSSRRKGCWWLTRERLRRGRCDRPLYYRAKLTGKQTSGTVKWKLKLGSKQRKSMRAGQWSIRSRAIDMAGNREKALKAKRNLQKLVIGRTRK